MAAERRVVLASGNPGKLREFRDLMAELPWQVVPLSQFVVPEAAETGASFVENAILKARYAAHHTGLPAVADDSGLEVDVLAGEPGICSARYAGPAATDQENLRRLLDRIAATGADRPAARFQCAMAFMHSDSDAMPEIAQGTWDGYIVMQPRGSNGFGYDPVFFVPTHACTAAELPPEVKNRISHRAQAMNELRRKLSARLRRQSRAVQ